MNDEIIILDQFPIVLTKEAWKPPNKKLEPGSIVRLPKDAVLVTAPPPPMPRINLRDLPKELQP